MPRTYADLLKEARATIKEVTPAQVGALQPGDAAIVDVREASEWEQGHLPDAIHISKSYVEQQIENAVPDRDTPVILYCAGGVRSLFAAQTLTDMGYTDVVSVKGGFQAWKGAGFEFDTPVTGPLRTEPHVAYRVDDVQRALQGLDVLAEPFDVGDGFLTVAFAVIDGAVVEFMQYANPDEEGWF